MKKRNLIFVAAAFLIIAILWAELTFSLFSGSTAGIKVSEIIVRTGEILSI